MLRPDTIALTGLLALLVALGPVATDLYVASMPVLALWLMRLAPGREFFRRVDLTKIKDEAPLQGDSIFQNGAKP